MTPRAARARTSCTTARRPGPRTRSRLVVVTRIAFLKLGRHLSVAALLGLGLVGCGADESREPAAPVATAAATQTAGDVTAGRVALAYQRAIMRNDYDA